VLFSPLYLYNKRLVPAAILTFLLTRLCKYAMLNAFSTLP